MPITIFFSVLLMGFLGSLHCGVMCGPLSCNFKNREQFSFYHVGRLLSYLIIGAILFVSSHYLIETESRHLKLISSVIFSLLFFLFGMMQLNAVRFKALDFKLFKLQFKILKKSQFLIDKFPVVLGLLTGLFPCSWLYTFLFFSTQMKELNQALLVIFLFWLTSLPAFFILVGFMRTLIKKSPFTYQKISGFILIAAGVFSVISHWLDVS